MIKVQFTLKNGKVCHLVVKGHAEYASKGHDIVCSAVSGIVLGGLNALEMKNDEVTISDTPNKLDVTFKRELSEREEIVLQTIYTQLLGISESYPQNLALERKEI